ncbi:MAG: hypothetical protein J1F28_04590 [Oscillospiraceae bacterium]|nr:hypothetical protein [Oscillospiraceae bacterium]
MGMYDIKTAELKADNFLAGDFPVVMDFGKVKTEAKIRKRAVLVQGEDGIEELTKEMISPAEEPGATGANALDNIIGISAEEPSGDEVVYYATGEFFAEGLILPDGVTAADIKPACRKLGIFIKEMKNNG